MWKNHNIIICLSVLVIVLFMSIGYAYYGQLLEFSGSVSLEPDGKFRIDNVMLVDSSNVISSELPIFSENSIEFNLVFGGTNEDYYAIYAADLINESSYNYTFNSFNFIGFENRYKTHAFNSLFSC